MDYRIIYKDVVESDVIRDVTHISINQGFIHFHDEDNSLQGSANLELIDSVVSYPAAVLV